MPKAYNKTNFHKHTFCIFKEVPSEETIDLKLGYTSKSGSSYYFTDAGLYRVSNHWGRAANCRWRLVPIEKSNNVKTKIGFACWSDFYPNNENDKLFYVELNPINGEISFQHKDNPEYDGKAQLRNAAETAKTIRQLQEIMTTENWAKYLIFEDLDSLRKEVASALMTTNQSFLEIKRKITENGTTQRK